VDDQELKYGLSVTGTIDPENILRKEGAWPGDKLILTKPLGTGIISTAVKGGLASKAAANQAAVSMAALNRQASEIMMQTGVHACTDITGFGLLGHAAEMIENTEVGMIIYASHVPLFPEARELADMGMIPAGLYRNRDFRKTMVEIDLEVSQFQNDILFDPQTSGGLLISVAAEKASILLNDLHAAGVAGAAMVGEIIDHPKGKIVVKVTK
jgi:selenide,water dikinase